MYTHEIIKFVYVDKRKKLDIKRYKTGKNSARFLPGIFFWNYRSKGGSHSLVFRDVLLFMIYSVLAHFEIKLGPILESSIIEELDFNSTGIN